MLAYQLVVGAGKNRPDELVASKIMGLMYLVAHPPISSAGGDKITSFQVVTPNSRQVAEMTSYQSTPSAWVFRVLRS